MSTNQIGTCWIDLYVNCDIQEHRSISWDATYFDSFGVEHIPKEIQKLYKNIIINIYRIQAFDLKLSIHLYWIIYFMLKGKSLLDHTQLFSPNQYEKNNKIIL